MKIAISVLPMRIKAVLRDNEILGMSPASKERIISTAHKNLDRVVSLSSLLKVMGLKMDDRIEMLRELSDSKIHIWLAKDVQQDIVYMSREDLPADMEISGYQWQ